MSVSSVYRPPDSHNSKSHGLNSSCCSVFIFCTTGSMSSSMYKGWLSINVLFRMAVGLKLGPFHQNSFQNSEKTCTFVTVAQCFKTGKDWFPQQFNWSWIFNMFISTRAHPELQWILCVGHYCKTKWKCLIVLCNSKIRLVNDNVRQ